ncbi:hypothetical protein P280DRAFT_289531 [Massarina eburnea CBS 473.64]|uniref:WD40 repeat-like protein n=1 Tax=Massarina eburnea CBS 473.64 TaxID=1395130 RepID=A0A6A6S3W0_9PLEO|nr:hypothetical protein P280DRAFT_289531 [Massarina eburnea CBS 473.64]
MEKIDVSPQFKSTSLSVPSPAASHVAHLTGARLQIRDLTTFEIVRNIALPSSQNPRTSRIVWSPIASSRPATTSSICTPPRKPPPTRSHRFLVTDDDTTRVYDLRDDKWNAVITNGSGGMGKNVHVEFGRDDEEVLCWSGFFSRVVMWCLRTGRTVEIRDPKYEGRVGRGWGYRPSGVEEDGMSSGRGGIRGRGGAMAILCRTSGQDVLMILAPRSYTVIKKVELPTIDAQGLKWSRDGRWIAVWESASHGYLLCIYTADGHLYRTITREPSDEPNQWGIEGLGIKTVEWIPGNEWLAVGGWDRRVRILSTRTFAPAVFLDHTATIYVPGAPVYTEGVDSLAIRSYTLTQQPAEPPKAVLEKNETGLMKQGIGIMAFSKSGMLCATRDDSTPTTVWIWDLTSLKPQAIIIQHAPIKSLQWHPKDPSKLLIQTAHVLPILYIYIAPQSSKSRSISRSISRSSSSKGPETVTPPTILDLASSIKKPVGSIIPKWAAHWLSTSEDKKPALVFGHQHSYILVWPEGKDQILRFEDQEGEDSDDSLYNILTGRTPVPPLHGGRRSVGSIDSGLEDLDDDRDEAAMYEESMAGGFEDTFMEKMRGGSMGVDRRGRSVLNESGLDEMF